MRILHVISSVDPKGGGPAESVLQRGRYLLGKGHGVEVASLDNPTSAFLTSFDFPVHALGPGIGGNYQFSDAFVPWLTQHAESYDAIVVDGLWQYHSLGTWRALHGKRVPYFVFPHGMLDPWFKRTYPLKHLKKLLYWPWAEYRVLRDARAVLFTCEEERIQARLSFSMYKANEHVVRYGTSSPPSDGDRLRTAFLAQYPELHGKRVLVFLSRIHEKKGCDLLVKAFARVADLDPTLHLLMVGPDQSGWVPALKGIAEACGISSRITWAGMLTGDMKWGAFYSSEVFVLPSHQENFGIAVAEALGCNLPVLISDKVNIWREIQEDGAGLVAPDTLDGTESLLRRWLVKDPTKRAGMARQASVTFENRFTVDVMANSMLEAIDKYRN